MPTTSSADQYQRASSVVSMAFRGRSVLSLRRSVLSLPRNQVAATDQIHENDFHDFDHFQSHVADQLLSLVPADGDHLPSLPFLHKLLDAFLSCEHEFKNLLLRNPGLICRSQVDRLLSELLDRSVKSLDICNELRQNLQLVRHRNRHADIAGSVLTSNSVTLGEGQLNRTRKALGKLLSAEQNDANPTIPKTERALSFLCRHNNTNVTKEESSSSSSSRSLSRTWSAGKQLQAMSANLTPPRCCDASGGTMALAVYTMSSVLVFAMWAIVAAFPVTSSAPVAVPVWPPRQLAWGPAMVTLQERIGEEWKKRGRKGGVLGELLGVERCGRELMESVVVCTSCGGARCEVTGRARELGEASRRLEEGLGPFERQLREVFHRVVRSREEVIKCVEQSSRSSPPFIVM